MYLLGTSPSVSLRRTGPNHRFEAAVQQGRKVPSGVTPGLCNWWLQVSWERRPKLCPVWRQDQPATLRDRCGKGDLYDRRVLSDPLERSCVQILCSRSEATLVTD